MDQAIEELFPTTTPFVRAILAQVRRMVREVLPEATEICYHEALGMVQLPRDLTAFFMWRYRLAMSILDYSTYGTREPDLTDLLEGSGKTDAPYQDQICPRSPEPCAHSFGPRSLEAWWYCG